MRTKKTLKVCSKGWPFGSTVKRWTLCSMTRTANRSHRQKDELQKEGLCVMLGKIAVQQGMRTRASHHAKSRRQEWKSMNWARPRARGWSSTPGFRAQMATKQRTTCGLFFPGPRGCVFFCCLFFSEGGLHRKYIENTRKGGGLRSSHLNDRKKDGLRVLLSKIAILQRMRTRASQHAKSYRQMGWLGRGGWCGRRMVWSRKAHPPRRMLWTRKTC